MPPLFNTETTLPNGVLMDLNPFSGTCLDYSDIFLLPEILQSVSVNSFVPREALGRWESLSLWKV